MNRLTDKNNGACEVCGGLVNCVDCPLPDIFNKLAHYEDLEEQGRLVEKGGGSDEKNNKMF